MVKQDDSMVYADDTYRFDKLWRTFQTKIILDQIVSGTYRQGMLHHLQL